MSCRLPSLLARGPLGLSGHGGAACLVLSGGLSSSSRSPPPTTASSPSYSGLRPMQVRHAQRIARPLLPYQFTQLVRQTDGSTFTWRTCSPLPVHGAQTQDSRNHVLWQPSDAALRSTESDEAGKLRAFRGRYGRGWDLEVVEEEEEEEDEMEVGLMEEEEQAGFAAMEAAVAKDEAAAAAARRGKRKQRVDTGDSGADSLTDLISGYASADGDKQMSDAKKKTEVEHDDDFVSVALRKKKRRGFV